MAAPDEAPGPPPAPVLAGGGETTPPVVIYNGASTGRGNFGVSIPELLVGRGAAALPRVLVFMCDYLMQVAPTMTAAQLYRMVTEAPPDDEVKVSWRPRPDRPTLTVRRG